MFIGCVRELVLPLEYGTFVTVVVAVLVTCCVHAAELARRRIIILLGVLGMNFDKLDRVWEVYEEEDAGIGVEVEGDRLEADFGPPVVVVILEVGEVGNDFADAPAFPPIDSGLRRSLERRRSSLDGEDEDEDDEDVEGALKEKFNELITDTSPSLNPREISPS